MKVLLVLMFAVFSMNFSYANSNNYGQDMKGECKKGIDSTRVQQKVVSEEPASEEEQSVEVNTESINK